MNVDTKYFVKYNAGGKSADTDTQALALRQACYDSRVFRNGLQPRAITCRLDGKEWDVIEGVNLEALIAKWWRENPNA